MNRPTHINFCIDEVMLGVDVDQGPDGELEIQIEEIFPEGIYTERELKLLVKKELYKMKQENTLEILLNDMETKWE